MPSTYCKILTVPHCWRGIALTELLVAMLLGALLMLCGMPVVLVTLQTYTSLINRNALHMQGMLALHNISLAIRQAGFLDPASQTAPAGPMITGLEDSALMANSAGLDGARHRSAPHGDILALRFSGAAATGPAILHCGGAPVHSRTTEARPELAGGWSIYYTGLDQYGTNNLYCKYHERQFTAQSLARQVESFKVLYLVNLRPSGMPPAFQFLSAEQVSHMERVTDLPALHPDSGWSSVVAIHIDLRLRAETSGLRSGSVKVQPDRERFQTTVWTRNPH